VVTTPFKAPGTNDAWASVVLQFDGRDLDLGGTGGLDLAVISVDTLGRIHGSDVRRVDLGFDQAGRDRVTKSGLRVQVRVPLPKDSSTIRIAAADGASRRVGSIWTDVSVPDFAAAPLSMSGVLVTDSGAPETPTANADDDMRKWLPAPPSTRRSFGPNVILAWAAEVYQKNAGRNEVAVTTTITAADGHEVFRRELARADAVPPAGADRIHVSNRTSLDGFPPGAYILKIEARLAGASESVSRDVRFTVADAR
jgi:hypothetical protein